MKTKKVEMQMQPTKRYKRKSTASSGNQKKIYMTLNTLFLCVLFLLSAVMTSFAWRDFNQTKTNIFRGTVDNVDVVLHLIEKDANGVIQADPITPIMNAEFQLYRIENDGAETLISGGPWKTDASGKIIFDGRDENHPKLGLGKYVFVETAPAFGYTYDKDDAGNDITRYGFEITQADALSNQAVTVPAYNRRGSGTLAVKKTVLGDPPADAEFTYTVTFSDSGTYFYQIDGGEKVSIGSGGTFALKNGQTAMFENIPIGVQYHIVETVHPDYVISSTGHQGNITEAGSVADFVNTYQPEPTEGQRVKLRVTKVLAGEYPAADKYKDFNFTLIVDGKKSNFTLKPGESQSQYFEVAQGSQYEVIEEDYFADGYKQSITNGFGTVVGESTEVVVTNTFIGDPVVDIEGEKKWELNGNTDILLPEAITVRLKNGEAVVLEKVVKPDASGVWKYSFTAPKYDANRVEIPYTVEEMPIACFIPTYNGYNITNTYVTPVNADPPVITKVLEGENVPETKFAFVMEGLDGAPMPEGAVNNKKTIYITGGGQVEFGNMQFTMPGVYTYSIYEVSSGEAGWIYDSAKYTLSFIVTEAKGELIISERILKRNEEAADTVQFTNSYTEPPAQTVTVQGQKTWKHGSNPVANQPKTITLHVYADGKLAIQWQVSEQDNWSYSFELPRFAEDGHEIVYTVDEADVPNYKKTIDGYNLMNTYVGQSGDSVPPSGSTDGSTDGSTSGLTGVLGGATDTGDSASFVPWLVLMLASGTMLLIPFCRHRKKRKSAKRR